MKTIIVHGDNTLKSYQRIQKFISEAKTRSWEVVKLKESIKLSVPEQLSSNTLFSSHRFFILENITKLTKNETVWLKKNIKNFEGTLIVYHPNTITKNLLTKLPQPDKLEEYKLPKLIWNFLDSVYPQNAKGSLFLLHEVVKSEPVEFVFSLLAKHFHDLYWIKIDPHGLGYPSWRLGKLAHQASKFTEPKLKKIISQLAQADIKSKISQTKLVDSLDFILATELE